MSKDASCFHSTFLSEPQEVGSTVFFGGEFTLWGGAGTPCMKF